MKQYIYQIILFASVLTMATSCVKDKLYLLPEEDEDYFDPQAWKHANLKVHTLWDKTDTSAPPAEGYLVELNDDEYEAKDVTYEWRSIMAGEYSLFAYNHPYGVTIDENYVATVNREADGTLVGQPGFLYSSSTENTKILRGSTVEVDLQMHQLIHERTIRIYMQPGDENLVEDITATLNGVVYQVNLMTLEKGTDTGQITMPMTLTYREYNGQNEELKGKQVPVYEATVHIIDLIEAEEPLVFNVRFYYGTSRRIVVKVDEEAEEDEYDLDVETEGGITATIIDWNEMENDDITVR